jgi:hypothetical protein
MPRAALALVAIALSVAALIASSRAQTEKYMKREQTLQRSVQSGKELRIFTYSRWNNECEGQDPPGVEILNSPAHGTASLRPGTSTVKYIREGTRDCTGHVFPGLGVWYVSEPGFHGTDKFDYNIIDQNVVSHDTVVIQVK